jgi:NADPH:quinone reductase
MTYRRIVLASRPTGFPVDANFRLEEVTLPELKPGEFLVRNHYVSVDPYQRGRMNDVRSYTAPVAIGEVMTAGAAGHVEQSKNDRFAVGDVVQGQFGWQEMAVTDGAGVRKVDESLAPLSASLGVLGMPGLTAYFGLLDVCHPKAGETVLVPGAAGAVGTVVGQIAKIKGCYAAGIAGSDDKVNYLINELGFDAAYNYKAPGKPSEKLREVCPKGIDVYFDNVGGAITDAALLQLNLYGRVAICGLISQYNNTAPEMGPRLLGSLIVTRSRIQGLLVSDYASRFHEGLKDLSQWLREGKLKYHEQIENGIENTPRAFMDMLQGKNIGKMLVKLT